MLDEILARVAAATRPLVVLDVDSTLVTTQHRIRAILRDYAATPRASARARRAAAALLAETMPYDPLDALRACGLRDEPELEAVRQFWLPRFFGDAYLHHDRPIAGAVSYVNALHAAGATLVYLTTRDEPRMGGGTRASLGQLGFPVDEQGGARFELMPEPGLDGCEFKRARARVLRACGEVVAAFDNEPGYANVLAEELPQASVVLIDTIRPPDSPALAPGIRLLASFADEPR